MLHSVRRCSCSQGYDPPSQEKSRRGTSKNSEQIHRTCVTDPECWRPKRCVGEIRRFFLQGMHAACIYGNLTPFDMGAVFLVFTVFSWKTQSSPWNDVMSFRPLGFHVVRKARSRRNFVFVNFEIFLLINASVR